MIEEHKLCYKESYKEVYKAQSAVGCFVKMFPGIDIDTHKT